jgi:SAM-dependent methyltransferase
MDREFQRATLEVDDHHWWYRGRRRIIVSELERLPLAGQPRILDAGCGSGRTMVELARYGKVAGIELNPDAAYLARDRSLGEVQEGRIEELPWEDESFELVVCLDVLEHTPDDRVALHELRRVCRPGGFLLLTVPALPRLWSIHDELNHHYRRYTRQSLSAAAADSDWALARMTSFNSLLLPAAAVVRVGRRRLGLEQAGNNDLQVAPRWLNDSLEQPLRLESGWLRRGGTLPLGLSLLAVLRKPWAPA